MKCGKEKSIKKLDKLLESFAGDLGPPATKIPQEQHHGQACSWSVKSHLPAKGGSKSQRCVKPGPWFICIAGHQEIKCSTSLLNQSVQCKNCDE